MTKSNDVLKRWRRIKTCLVLGIILVLLFLVVCVYNVVTATLHKSIKEWNSTQNFLKRYENNTSKPKDDAYQNGMPDNINHINVTIVTMYINIGKFQKGTSSIFTPQLYEHWMKVFTMLRNPVVAFFDNEKDLEYFSKLRRRLGTELTKTILVDRSKLWAFQQKARIDKIFSQPNYPKHHPNTVVAEYSCAMHAKYEVMMRAAKVNFFKTKYFAWLDIGLFRSLANRKDLSFFELSPPPGFNASTVAYTEVYTRIPSLDASSIIRGNRVWVCGAFFIGQRDVIMTLSEDYKNMTEIMIYKYRLMSTDQQVLYVLYNWGQPRVRIQTYRNHDPHIDDWFYLGYLCKEQGFKRNHGLLASKSAAANV